MSGHVLDVFKGDSDGGSRSFLGETVKIAGRSLNAEVRPNIGLFPGTLRHRVPWIQEAGGPAVLEAAKDIAIIEYVKVK